MIMSSTDAMVLALHPLCTLFPRLVGAEFEALKTDIVANGQRESITVHGGLVLDGGNRYRACIEAGIEPQLKTFTGADPVAFVLSANLHRRHLTPGQQAAIVASAQDWTRAHGAGGDRKSDQAATLPLDSVADRAAQSGASERTQRMADKVAKESPELAKQVAHGEISLPKALEQLAPKGTAEAKSSIWPFPNASPGSPAAEFNASQEAVVGAVDSEEGDDDLYDQAVQVVLKNRRASISLVQRHLRIGYNRAARLIEQMERAGIVSPPGSTGDRLVMVPAAGAALVGADDDQDEDDDDQHQGQDDGDAADTRAADPAPIGAGTDDGHEQLLDDYNAVKLERDALALRVHELEQLLALDDVAAEVDALRQKCAQFDSLATSRFAEIAELQGVAKRQREFLDGLRRAAGLPKGGDLAAWIKDTARRAA
jgi:hypothetical protein